MSRKKAEKVKKDVKISKAKIRGGITNKIDEIEVKIKEIEAKINETEAKIKETEAQINKIEV